MYIGTNERVTLNFNWYNIRIGVTSWAPPPPLSPNMRGEVTGRLSYEKKPSKAAVIPLMIGIKLPPSQIS